MFFKTGTNCDDGNTIGGDGWSSTWTIERGWDWTGGSISSPDHCSTIWGDGILTTQYEQWDDGNRINGDWWNINWQIELNCVWSTNFSAPINSIWSEIWGDGKNMDLNPWDDGNFQSGDGCSSSWSIEAGFIWSGGSSTKKDIWTEKWGDSLDLHHNECEDGNLNDGDGWSSTCEFEKCYEWKGGDSTVVDTWSKLPITPIVKSVSTSNTVEIGFSHAMNKTEITLDDLSVSISYQYTISISWSAYYSNNQTLLINIDSQTVLTGEEKITIKFINYRVWRGPNGGCLTTDQLSATTQNSLADSVATANSISSFAQYSSYIGIAVTVALVLIGGGSLEMIWALLNTLQLISYLPLMTPFFPEPVRVMFEVLKFANMNFDFLSKAFYKITSLSILSSSQYSNLFTQNGIDTPLFLLNCASILMTLFGYILLFALSIILIYVVRWSKLRPYIDALASSFIFNNFIRFFAEGYLEMYFGSMLNVFCLRVSNTTEIISFAFSWIFLIVLFLFPFMSAALLYDKRKEIASENKTYLKRFGTVYRDFKENSAWYCLQFYPIFLMRRLVFASMLILLEGYPEIQWNIFILSCIMVRFI